MKLATQVWDFNGYVKTIPEKIALFAQTPFKYLDFQMALNFNSDSWRSVIEESADTAAKHGLTFVQAHSLEYNPYSSSHDFEADVKSMNAMIEACSILGIKNVVLHPIHSDGFSALYPDGREEFFAYNKKLYSLLFPAMEKYGISVLIENSCERNMKGKYFFMTGEDMRDFLDYVGHPLLKAVWDTGHANMRKNDQEKDIIALGSHLAGVHIHDNDGNSDGHTAPFMGTMNFDALMKGLITSGYDGYFTFEANNTLLRAGVLPYKRTVREDIGDQHLLNPTLELKLMAENLLYEIGKHILQTYNVFEE